MIRRVAVGLLLAALIAACDSDPSVRPTADERSGSGGDDTGNPGGWVTVGGDTSSVDGGADGATDDATGDGATGAGPTSDGPTGGDLLPRDAAAGAYVGRFAGGDGVLVLDRSGQLIGLSRQPDGSAVSWLARFEVDEAASDVVDSAPSRQFSHDGGSPSPTTRSGFSPLGDAPGQGIVGPADGESLRLLAGERIDTATGNGDVSMLASGRSRLAGVSEDSVSGRWEGQYRQCDSLGEHCARTVVQLVIADNELSGSSSVLTEGGADLFPSTIEGSMIPLGSFAEVTFDWNTYTYQGVMYFVADEADRLMLIGSTDRELADYPVLAFELSRN